ncbi:MAG: type I-U CRISPR-associated protein Csb2 [Actinomycetota bacterium]
MSTTIVITFPWGLYHATPWGHHVNEGAVEWPPSGWRILRGLYSVWQNRWPDLEAALVKDTLSKLSAPPEYVLEETYGEAHTRHYWPDNKHGTDKRIDAFGVLSRGAGVAVTWPADLDESQRAVVSKLAGSLPFLGRAESICDARVADPDEVFEGTMGRPIDDHELPAGQSAVRILTPRTPLDIGQLVALPRQVSGQRLTTPPGAYWQLYGIPENGRPAAPAPRHTPRVGAAPTAVRWAIAEPDRPSLYSALATTGVLRRACMSRAGDPPSAVLAGKDATGTPLTGHRHAHYLAIDEDGDRLIDHLLVWAPMGLGPPEIGALSRVTNLRAHEHLRDFRPARLGIEAVSSVATAAPELTGPSKIWTSVTPFLPPRHAKKRVGWEEHLDIQVRQELARRSWPEPETVEILQGTWLNFRRHRIEQRLGDAKRGGGLRITFVEDAGPGPLCLGALSHFGMGLFLPE